MESSLPCEGKSENSKRRITNRQEEAGSNAPQLLSCINKLCLHVYFHLFFSLTLLLFLQHSPGKCRGKKKNRSTLKQSLGISSAEKIEKSERATGFSQGTLTEMRLNFIIYQYKPSMHHCICNVLFYYIKSKTYYHG